MKRDLLFVPGKRKYVRGDRPKVDCILCAVRGNNPAVEKLILASDKQIFITMNLFPYNPGHLMIVPNRHVIDPRRFTAAEDRAILLWTHRLLDVLDEIYEPSGYNIGYNIGHASGASIEHVHQHIVPRFKNEVGFIDVIGEARVHVDDPYAAVSSISSLIAKKYGRRVSPSSPSRKAKPGS